MELRDLYKEKQEFLKKNEEKCIEKIISILQECGLYNVDVLAKDTKGVLKVEKYNSRLEIKFYPYKKDGFISLNSKYAGFYLFCHKSDEEIKKKLTESFKPIKED